MALLLDIYKEESNEVQKPKESTTGRFLNKNVLRLEQASDLLRVPTAEEFFFLQSDTAFNAFTFVLLVAKLKPIKHLYVCTYSISRRVIETLCELIDTGSVEQITLLISDSMIKRNPGAIDLLSSMTKSRGNFVAKFAWVHAKVCLMQTHDDFFVLEGSGNFAENAQYEQYLFANDRMLFEFRSQLFTNITFKQYAI